MGTSWPSTPSMLVIVVGKAVCRRPVPSVKSCFKAHAFAILQAASVSAGQIWRSPADACRAARSRNKTIFAQQRVCDLPEKSPVPLLQRKSLSALGKRKAAAAELEQSKPQSSQSLEAAARAKKAQREAQGMGDSVQEMQPVSAPAVDASLAGKRLESPCEYTHLPDGTRELLWFACEVLLARDGSNMQPRSKWKKGKAARRDYCVKGQCEADGIQEVKQGRGGIVAFRS
eukprot:6181887-Pleurochrysis_carterae.AAC.1